MRGTREGNDSDPRGSIPARSNNLQRAMQRHNGDASERAATGIHPSRSLQSILAPFPVH